MYKEGGFKMPYNELVKHCVESENRVSVYPVENVLKLYPTLTEYTDTIAYNRYLLYTHGREFILSVVKTVSGHFLKVLRG
jgi:hypothetical protein